MTVDGQPANHKVTEFTQQNIIEDYQTARKQVRHFSPDIGKRRFETLDGVKDDNI